TTLIVIAVLLFLVHKFWQEGIRYRAQLQRYAGIIDLEAAKESATRQLESIKQQAQQSIVEDRQRKDQLEIQYKQALARYETLQHEVSLLEENLDDISFGLYKPHFTFQSSEEYKDAL